MFCLFVRNLLGEDLGPLSSKELESLERQLDMSLKQIRSTRVLDLLIVINWDSKITEPFFLFLFLFLARDSSISMILVEIH